MYGEGQLIRHVEALICPGQTKISHMAQSLHIVKDFSLPCNLLRKTSSFTKRSGYMKPPCFVYTSKHDYNQQTWRFHVTVKNKIIYT